MEKYEEVLKKLKREELESFVFEKLLYDTSIRASFEVQFSRIFF